MSDNLNSMNTLSGGVVAMPPVTVKQPDNTAGKQQGSLQNGTSSATMSQQTAVDAGQGSTANNDDTKAASQVVEGKAFFAVDDDKNVVIKVTDSAGKVVRQIPAEDYLQMVKVLDENAKSMLQSSTGKNMFHKEA